MTGLSAEFYLTSLIVVLLPGPGVLYTLAWGLGRGWLASIVAAFGCTLGILPHMAASIAGLAALLHASALAFRGVKYLGALYLLYMAFIVLRESGPLNVTERQGEAPVLKIVSNGFLINILNPKLSLFFLAFLPQFVPADAGSPTAAMLVMAVLFMAMTFVVFVIYGYFASLARIHVLARPHVMRWLRYVFAAAFALLALRLAFAAI